MTIEKKMIDLTGPPPDLVPERDHNYDKNRGDLRFPGEDYQRSPSAVAHAAGGGDEDYKCGSGRRF